MSCSSIIYLFFKFNNNKIKCDDYPKPIIINGEIYTECGICYNEIKLKDIKMIYPCGHRLYCNDCISNIQKKCPMCRKDIVSYIIIYENLYQKNNVS